MPRERLLCWIALGAILVVGTLVRVLPLTAEHYWDETVYLQHARILLDGRANYDEFHYRPPLLPFVYAFGFALWDHIHMANVVQGIFAGLSILFGFLYARRAFGELTALVAAALFAFTPYFVEQSHLLLTDVPAVALMLAAMWLFDRPRLASALGAGVTSSLAVQTRFTSLFVLTYFAADSLFAGVRWRRLVCVAAGALVAIAPYLLWMQWTYGNALHGFEHARRITTEWTAPIPAGFYFDALTQIFTASLAVLFAVGVVAAAAHGIRAARVVGTRRWHAALAAHGGRVTRVATLVAWGAGFLVYMLTIPHKEVRYLLPLAIPAVVVAAYGAAELCAWAARLAPVVRIPILLSVFATVVLDDAPAIHALRKPWVDDTASETMQIAQFIREVSAPTDTLYAAHEFPVLAYYAERRTVSVLTIQDTFNRDWRRLMSAPGYFVYYAPVNIGETHARSAAFLPDLAFLGSNPEFRVVRTFPHATVYRYVPSQ